MRHQPGEIRIAALDETFIVLAQPRAILRKFRIVIVDHRGRIFHQRQRLFHRAGEFAVGDQDFRAAMLQHIGDGRGIEPGVDRVQHRARHRHAMMGFQHRRRVGQHRRHRVVLFDPARRQRRGQFAATAIKLGIAQPGVAMNHRDGVGIGGGGTRQMAERRQRLEIGGIAVKPGVVRAGAQLEARHRRQRPCPRPLPGMGHGGACGFLSHGFFDRGRTLLRALARAGF